MEKEDIDKQMQELAEERKEESAPQKPEESKVFAMATRILTYLFLIAYLAMFVWIGKKLPSTNDLAGGFVAMGNLVIVIMLLAVLALVIILILQSLNGKQVALRLFATIIVVAFIGSYYFLATFIDAGPDFLQLVALFGSFAVCFLIFTNLSNQKPIRSALASIAGLIALGVLIYSGSFHVDVVAKKLSNHRAEQEARQQEKFDREQRELKDLREEVAARKQKQKEIQENIDTKTTQNKIDDAARKNMDELRYKSLDAKYLMEIDKDLALQLLLEIDKGLAAIDQESLSSGPIETLNHQKKVNQDMIAEANRAPEATEISEATDIYVIDELYKVDKLESNRALGLLQPWSGLMAFDNSAIFWPRFNTYEFNIEGLNIAHVATMSKHQQIFAFTTDGQVFGFSFDNSGKYDFTPLKDISSQISQVQDAATDDNASKLYLLDANAGSLWEFAAEKTGLSEPIKKSVPGIDLTKGVSIATDGAIYILDSDGNLTKVLNDTTENIVWIDFPVPEDKQYPPTIESPIKIFTDSYNSFLYILESSPSYNRIVVTTKDGHYIAQYHLPYAQDLIDIVGKGQSMHILQTDGTVLNFSTSSIVD
jgi:hypothetical protein